MPFMNSLKPIISKREKNAKSNSQAPRKCGKLATSDLYGLLMRTHGTELFPVLSNDRTGASRKDLSQHFKFSVGISNR